MTDLARINALRAAILPVLPANITLPRSDDEERRLRLADAIVDAVMAVQQEDGSVEWAYRYPNGHVATWIPQLMTEDLARHMVAEYPDLLTVVRRRVTEWEDAT